jgi:hypothetical protein
MEFMCDASSHGGSEVKSMKLVTMKLTFHGVSSASYRARKVSPRLLLLMAMSVVIL